jgi:biotin operon repressor
MQSQLRIFDVVKDICRNKMGKVPPLFCEYHVLKTLLLLQLKSASRELLMRELHIGESSVRTLINRLKRYGLISTCRKSGCSLTEDGQQSVNEFRKIVPRIVSNINLRRLRLGYFNAGALIKNFPVHGKMRIILWIRDLIVRNGGDAALILQATVNGIIIPPVEVDDWIYEDLVRIKEVLKPDQNDLIIISFAQTQYDAEKALFTTLMTILNMQIKENYFSNSLLSNIIEI